jgi:molybdate transport system ATP-binding protein
MNELPNAIAIRFSGLLGSFNLDVEFEAPMRGITALFGPSGSGKTSVLRCVAGLDRLSGRLAVGGELWQDSQGAFREPHQRSVGYVFQEASLFPHLSVRDNLLYGHKRAVKAGASSEVEFDAVVGLMGIRPLLERSTTALSGGERQRVAIGRALLSQPRLLLMDEPLAALDQKNKEEILPFLEALHNTLSIPILYVSHDISEVERLADVLVLLNDGKVVACGPLMDVLADGRLPMAYRTGAAAILEGRVEAFDPQYGLTEMTVNGETLLVPGRVGTAGESRRLRIAASDVSLSPERPSRTSILNVLPVQVRDIQRVDEAQTNVTLSVGHGGSGPALLARISRRACESLQFACGQRIYAQVKAVSLVGSNYSSRFMKS